MAAAPLRPACFLFLFVPPPLSIGSYQSTEGEEGAGKRGRGTEEGTARERPRERQAWVGIAALLPEEGVAPRRQR